MEEVEPMTSTEEKVAENQADQLAEPPAEKPAEETTEKPAEETTEKPAEEITEKPAEETTEKPAEETAENPPDDQPPEKPDEQPAEKTEEQPGDKPKGGEEVSENVEGETVVGEIPGEATTVTTASHTELGEEEELEGEYEEYTEEIEEEIEGEDGEILIVTKLIKKKKLRQPKKEEAGEEELKGEHEELEEEQIPEIQKEEEVVEEVLEEEEMVEEEAPPDPAAPLDLSDSKELLRTPFQLRPDQLAECEQLWQLYQDHTPAYADLDNFITEVELIYMLKCLMIMTYTPEQLQELIVFCVRPPHPEGHVNFEQFVHMVTIRQRDFVPEEELRSAMRVFDAENTGLADREQLREVLTKHGHKMHAKKVDELIREVDMSNDGTIGVEDVVGTLAIDLNREDIEMLQNQLNPDLQPKPTEEEDI